MKTTHQVFFTDSKHMENTASESVDLIVTSPPYPMIQMWDDMFGQQDATIRDALENGQGSKAFELMHKIMDPVWDEIYRVLKPGRLACINIGDATRTIEGNFSLYANHSRILSYLLSLGFSGLPNILWRKQTNAPNKFMGSGMLPGGAYVTLEHEYILIMRKGPKREFKKPEAKQNRRESALFWEERNVWFSDVWFDIKGTTQGLSDDSDRLRSAAYPFELAYRLINMFSAKGDVVLDPFSGTGTTTAAAIASARNSVGFEIDPSFLNTIHSIKDSIVEMSNERIRNRLESHLDFVKERTETKGELKHTSMYYGFPVMTSQEKELILNDLEDIREGGENILEVVYSENPQRDFCGGPNQSDQISATGVSTLDRPIPKMNSSVSKKKEGAAPQLELLD